MDRARTSGKENLTVALCHERFQNETSFTIGQKQAEAALFQAALDMYESGGMRDFRNKRFFHIDLNENLQPHLPGSGTIREMTLRLQNWYAHVATAVWGTEPTYVTNGAWQRGRDFVREYRRMMVTQRRAWLSNMPDRQR